MRLTGWLCLAENMPSGNAVRPERRPEHPRRHDGRGREHRRRGSARAGRRPGRGIRGAPGRDHRRRHPHRRAGRRARHTATRPSWATTTLVERVLAASQSRRGAVLADAASPRSCAPRLDSDVADIENATPGRPGRRHDARRRVPQGLHRHDGGRRGARSRGRTSTSPGAALNEGERLRLQRTGRHRRLGAHPARAGRVVRAQVVRS